MARIQTLLENTVYNGNSLKDLMDENSINEEPSLFSDVLYYDNNKFIDTLKKKNDSFNVLSLNCQSLNAKFSQLQVYIELLKQNNVLISAICLQETWLSEQDDCSLLQLEDYNFISKGKSCSAHGGVAIYLHKQFNYFIQPHQESNSWDGLFIKVMIESNSSKNLLQKSLVIGSVYRPPRQNVDQIKLFSNEIIQLIDTFSHFRYVVMGGISILIF